MSNVKDIRIKGRVPFTWLHTDADHPLSAEDAAFVATWVLSPSTGVFIHYEEDGYEPNEHGGRTAFYRICVYGQEAMAWPAIEKFKQIIERSGGSVTSDETYDWEEAQRS